MIQQVTFEIPPDIAARLLTGELVQHGGVVRQLTGEIYKHLKEVDLPPEEGRDALRVPQVLRNPWVIGSVVVAGDAAAGAGTYVAVKGRRQTAALLTDYREALRAYVAAVQEGQLDTDVIDRLLTSLDAVVAGHSKAALDSVEKEAPMITAIVKDSTDQLASHNQLELPAIELIADGVDRGRVVELRERLTVQRSIFDQAA